MALDATAFKARFHTPIGGRRAGGRLNRVQDRHHVAGQAIVAGRSRDQTAHRVGHQDHLLAALVRRLNLGDQFFERFPRDLG